MNVDRDLLVDIHAHPDCPVEFIDHLRRAINQSEEKVFKRCTILKECCTKASASTEAAQPPPVKAGTTSEKYKAELYDEVWKKARDMGFANVTDALAELEKTRATKV